jgi:hypothetical protein
MSEIRIKSCQWYIIKNRCKIGELPLLMSKISTGRARQIRHRLASHTEHVCITWVCFAGAGVGRT